MTYRKALPLFWLTTFAFLGGGVLGCSTEEPGLEGGEEAHATPEEEACEHLQEGPSQALTASGAPTASAPAVKDDHTRYDVTLVAGAAGNSGVVRFAASEAGLYDFFLSRTLEVSAEPVANPGTLAPSSTVEGLGACDEIAQVTKLNLEVGTYYLHLGPTSESSFSVVVEKEEATTE